ncbi:MAG: nuclear transport factor 2 family protein [Acetobacteraceae bacterium]|nr:nuclear transport factor 2 family protein [Acetobacteraceae bacterium]
MHKRFIPMSLLAAGATVGGIAAAPPAHAQSDPLAICRASKAAWEAAMPAGDPSKIAALFTPDAVWVSPEGTFGGRQEITRYIETWLKPGAKIVTTPASGHQTGDVVLCSGESTFTAAPGSAGPAEVTDHWATALVKNGNSWVNAQLATIHPPMSPPPSQAQAH